MGEVIEVYQRLNHRRNGGVVLGIISILPTIVWGMIAWPPSLSMGYLAFLLGGPGLLGFSLWAVFSPTKQRVRLQIKPDGICVYPDKSMTTPVSIPFSSLNSVSQTGGSFSSARLRFASTTGTFEVTTEMLDRHPDDIIRLVTIQLENLGKHLSQTSSPILGAQTGVWEVQDGIPFSSE